MERYLKKIVMNNLTALRPISSEKTNVKTDEFENKYKFKLKNEFKHILNFNICKPQKTLFKNEKLQINLNYFFGFSEKEYEDLFQNYETYLGRMPENLFPIGSIDGGDILCMDKDTGEIYYWFHEEDDWGLEGVTNLPTKIASSVNEYLDLLILNELPSLEKLEKAKKEGKINSISPIGLQLLNNDRQKRGLPPLTMEEALNQ